MVLVFILFSILSYAQTEVYKHEFPSKMRINFIRAQVDEMSTYKLTSTNGRDMFLVCSKNRFYDNNELPFLEYRNFYNQKVARFDISDNRICLDLGRFIEAVDMGINEKKYFSFDINTQELTVDKIIYPAINPFLETGSIDGLLPKKPVKVKYTTEKTKIIRPKININ